MCEICSLLGQAPEVSICWTEDLMCIPSSISVPLVLTPSPFDHRTLEETSVPLSSERFPWGSFKCCANNLHLVLLLAETWESEGCLQVQSPALASNCKAVITLWGPSQTFARGQEKGEVSV